MTERRFDVERVIREGGKLRLKVGYHPWSEETPSASTKREALTCMRGRQAGPGIRPVDKWPRTGARAMCEFPESQGEGKSLTKRFCASLKHNNVGQKNFIKPNSQR